MDYKEGTKVTFYIIDNCGKIRKKVGVIAKQTVIEVEVSGNTRIYTLEEVLNYLSDDCDLGITACV